MYGCPGGVGDGGGDGGGGSSNSILRRRNLNFAKNFLNPDMSAKFSVAIDTAYISRYSYGCGKRCSLPRHSVEYIK